VRGRTSPAPAPALALPELLDLLLEVVYPVVEVNELLVNRGGDVAAATGQDPEEISARLTRGWRRVDQPEGLEHWLAYAHPATVLRLRPPYGPRQTGT